MDFVQKIRKCRPQEVLVKQNEEKEIASNGIYNDGEEKNLSNVSEERTEWE